MEFKSQTRSDASTNAAPRWSLSSGSENFIPEQILHCVYICISVQTSTWWSSSRQPVRMRLRMLHHDYCWVDAESALGKVVLLIILLCIFLLDGCLPHSLVSVLWFNMWLVSRVPFCGYFLSLWSLGTTYCFVEWILLVWCMADDFGWTFPPCGSERIYDLNATCGKQGF